MEIIAEIVFYWIFVVLSAALFGVAVYYMFARKLVLGKWQINISRLMLVSGVLLLSAYFLRFAVGMYMNQHPDEDYISLNVFEELGNSFVHALQTFSMDEDYTLYIQKSKEMIQWTLGAQCSALPANIVGVYSALIGSVAPIAGGALVLEILANMFPSMRLWYANKCKRRPKYYFNELNERSILLAKSLQEVMGQERPVFVFAYANASEDLLNAAKKLEAICLQTDLEQIRKCKVGERNYFLISEDENVNLRTLAGLSQKSCGGYLTKANIYLFTTGDAYLQLESKMYENLIRWGMPQDKLPLLYPIRTAHNMIANLLVDVPLYEPLIHKALAKKDKLRLKLTILGCGTYGMEMLLSSYSFGQMLDCELQITVVSRETPEEFWDKLHAASPELMATTKEFDSILCYDRKGNCCPPYCSVSYISCDVHSKSFLDLLSPEQNGPTLRDTDYFLVSLGDDSSNIAASELLTRHVGTWHLYDRDARTVIACVVTDSDMDRLLGEQHSVDESIYLHVIGGTHEVYSVKNVLMDSHAKAGDSKHESYKRHNRDEQLKKQSKRQKDAYSHYSSMAKAMHLKYRVFSTSRMLPEPLVTESVFTTEGHKSARYIKAQSLAKEGYMKFLGSNGKTELTQEEEALHTLVMHRLAWMEHRRWNAYIRASGFRYTDQYMSYAKGRGTHKNLKLKLHPCLVECGMTGILGRIYPDGKVEEKTLQKAKAQDPAWVQAYGSRELDLLDELSFDLFHKGINSYDFKFYDYPDDHLDRDGNLLPEAGGAPKEEKPKEQEQKKEDKRSRKEQLRSTDAGKDGALSYVPHPADLSEIALPEGWAAIREEVAKAVHEQWMRGRLEEGWSLGPQRDDGLRTSPCLVPYEQLPESEKDYDRITAEETVKAVIKFGYRFVPITEGCTAEETLPDLEQLAENVHETWAKKRMDAGWVWGEIREGKATPLLIPYAALPESEKKYDRATAQCTLAAMKAGYVICKE